mgnify:CR=1 FL=1
MTNFARLCRSEVIHGKAAMFIIGILLSQTLYLIKNEEPYQNLVF